MTDDRGNMSFSDPQLEFFNFDALSDDEVQRIKNVLKQPCSAVELPDLPFSSSAKDQVNGVQADYKSVPVAIMDYSHQVASTYATMAQPHMYSVASTVNGTTYITGYAVPGANLYVASPGRKDYLIPKMMNGIDGVENGGGGALAEQVVDANGVAGMVVSSNIYPAPPWANVYPCPTYVMPTFFTPIAPVHAAGIRASTSTVTMCGENVIPSTVAPPPPMPSPTAYVAVAAAPVPIQSSVLPAEASVLQQSSMPAEIVSSLDQNCEQSYVIDDEVYYDEKTSDSFEPSVVADEEIMYEKEQAADNYDCEAESFVAASQREVIEETKPDESEECAVEAEAASTTPSVTPTVNAEVVRPTAAVNKTWASLFKSKEQQHSAPQHQQQQPSPVVTPSAVQSTLPPLMEATTEKEKRPVVSVVNDRNSAATPVKPPTTTTAAAANVSASPKVDYCHTNGLVKEPTSSDRSLGELLMNMKVDQRPVNVSPRGLVNKGNWCYINATLQALLACPPFYNFLCKLPNVVGLQQGKTNSPITDCMVEFVHEFSPSNNVGGGTASGRRKDDQPPVTIGHHFEPVYIYNIMSKLRSDSFEGRQEDAEEFLTCLLNGLHEEMLAAISSVESSDKENEEQVMEQGDEDDESWKVIEKGNKSSVTRSATFSSSPVSDIFCGSIRSALHAVSISSTTLQPFFSLQLDIQSENVRSVKEALLGLVTKETLQGYHCTKTKQEVAASRQMTLEELPPILILHLKRFVYNKDGGCQKLSKRLDFKINLEFGKELLSSTAKTKLGSNKHKHYKLIAVVYHCGREAVKGHYIADVYHHGSSAWLRADDTRMTVVQESEVLNHPNALVPYLLFYRRLDGAVTNSTGNVK